MQKKILLSLLVASPATLPAVANIDYGHGTWSSEGLSSDDSVKIDSEAGDVSCVLGSGPTKWIATELLPGKYQLSFNSITNLAVTVSQNGTELAKVSGKESVEFEIKGEGEVTITAQGITANAYSFTGANLQLVFDFQQVGNALQTQLDAIEEYVTITDEKYPGAKELLESKAGLVSQAEGYQATIDKIKSSATENKELQKLYKDQKLYEDPSVIGQNIADLAEAVEAWNEDATALNNKIQNTADNTAAKTALLAEQGELLTNIDALIEKIKEGSEYGQQQDLAAAETIKGNIEDYKTAINTAYADDKLDGEIEFESQTTALQTAIDNLDTKWTDDEADWDAYQTFMNTVFPDLQNGYNDAVDAINQLSGVKGFETVFASQKEEAVDAVKAEFDQAKADLNITSAAGAAGLLADDQKIVEDANAEIKKIVDNITELVTTQNENKNTAAQQIQDFNQTLADNEFTIVPSALEEDYNAAVEDIQNKIAELGEYVADKYQNAELDLTDQDYLDKVSAIEDALSDFEELVAPIAEINQLAKDFQDAKEHVQEVSDELGTDFINLYGLFDAPDGTFASIENAIKNLSTEEEVESQKEAINKSIKDVIDTADQLAEVFTQLQAADAQYTTDATDLQAFVNAKIEIDNKGANATALKTAFMAETGKGGKFVAAQQKFHTDLLALASGEQKPQTIYDNAVALSDANIAVSGEEVEYKWVPDLEQIKTDFAKQVTESNKTNLDTILDAAKTYVADGTYEGQNSLDFEEIDTKVGAIAAEITEAADAEDPIAAYGDVDEDIVNLIPDINAVKTLAEKYKQNQADYDALVAKLGVPGLQEGITKLILQNAQESKDNGKDYFDNFINGADNENSLQAQLDKIQKDLDDALAEYADPEKNVTGNKADFEAKISALSGLITKTATDITNNNTTHTQQLNTAEQVAEYIVTAFDTLDQYYREQTGIEEWYEETKEKLTTLRDEDLFNNNLAVSNAYGEGKSYTDNDALIGEYERIYNEVESLVNGMLDEYTQAVIAANNAVVTEAKWDATKKSMNDEYVSAITTFNSYYYGLTNPGWKAAVMEEVERHQDIYQYSQKINDLIAEVNEYIKDNNEAPATFTAAQFQENATDKANDLIAEMQAKVDDLNTKIAALAETYYTENHDAAETQIDGYQAQLDAAGITGKFLDEVKGALADAESKYAKATGDEATQPLGLAMDRIADDLDKANQTVDLQTVAENAWSSAYSDAKEAADDILADLNDSSNTDYKFADPDVREQAAEDVAEKIQDMVELNGEVADVKTDLIDDYKDYKDQLEQLLSDIENLAQSVKDNSDNNKANEDLYNTLVGTTIPDLESAYKELVEYSESLAGGQKFDTDAIKSQIDALKSYVESNTGSLAANEETINNTCESIENAITAGYPQIGSNEYQYLNGTLLDQVKVAFNDAKAAFMGAEGTESNIDKETGETQINEWNNEIDKLAEQVAALNEMLDPADFDKAEFQKTAQDLEAALSDLYVAMEQTWTGENHDGSNPAADIIAQLEDEYNKVKDAISEAETYLQGCEEGLDTTEFADALQAASDALDAEKADWESIGNRVITMQPTYSEAMQDIADKVADTLDAAEKANEQAIADAAAKAANEAAYATLTGELDELRSELERVAELAETWFEGEYEGNINYISGLIDDAEEDLKYKYDNTQLTETSTLPNKVRISSAITSLEHGVTRRHAEDLEVEADNALKEVENALMGNVVPEEAETIQSQLEDLRADFDDNVAKQNDSSTITVAGMYEVIAEYERIIEEAGDLKTTTEQNSYVPGDVDLNPDGQVTAADVQTLIRWVLEGMSWKELLAENPRQAYAADLNGDQDLNITDVTMDISLMFGENPAAVKTVRMAAAPMTQAAPAISQNGIGVELVSEENGVRRYAVMLSNTDQLIAGQLDLKLASGMSVKNITTAERTSSHAVESLEKDFSTVRVVLYSMENAVIEGESGAIIYVDVEGSGDLKTGNVIFTDHLFNTLGMDGTEGTSFIDSIVDGAKEMGNRFYNAAGVMFNKLQKGINIFRDKDGKVKKQYHRN